MYSARHSTLLVFLTLLLHLLITTALPNKNGRFELVILHNNDMHARFEQTSVHSNLCQPEDVIASKCYGGFARVAYMLQKYRKEAANGGPPVLYLNAGDTYTGTPWFTLYEDKIVTEFLNILKPDAISLGNHEFDLGLKGLIPFLNGAEFPVLATNLDLSKTPEMTHTKALNRSTVFNIKGVQVGVIGYLTPETKILAKPNDVEFLDEIPAINKEATNLKSRGINIIIALGHSGFDVDKDIARGCPDIDLVIGGHSNTFLYTGPQPDAEQIDGPYPVVITQKSGKKVPVVQAYAFTKYLGHLKLSFDDQGNLITFSGEPILLNGDIPRDPRVLEVLEKYRPGIIAMQKEVIGVTKVLLNGTCRFDECNLGNLVADSMVYANAIHYFGEYWTDASIAFVQGGGIRGSVSIGNITVYDITLALPFDSGLVKIQLTGNEILETLEHSVKKYSNIIGMGEFLQMSGIRVVFNLTKPSGSRVESVQVLCANCSTPRYYDLEKTKIYKVVITTFLNSGGDGYDVFNKKDKQFIEISDLDAMTQYLKALKVVYPAVEWRNTLIGKVADDDSEEPDGASRNFIAMGTLLISVLISILRRHIV